MPLLERLQKDIVTAMKSKDEARLGTLRMMKAALQKQQIDAMAPLTEAGEMQVLNTLIKQRQDSAEQFRKGAREEMAVKEEGEIKLIEEYLPGAPTDEEMATAVAEAMAETGATSAKQMGVVMKAAQAKLAGKRIDGKALSELVKSKLN